MKDDDRIQSDGITVWVHDSDDGSCIGRFGRMGIDVHRSVSEQSSLGQCLLCTHGVTGPAEWLRFVAAMKDIYGVTVTERHRPRHIPPSTQEKTMQKIKMYVVTAEHHVVPGRPMSIHFSPEAADSAAFALVESIARDVRDVPQADRETSGWRQYLADVQRAIVTEGGGTLDGEENDDDLIAMSDCYVDIAIVEADAPRVIVALEGGLVQGIVGDIPLDAYVVDYDTEGSALRDLIDIPQSEGTTSEGLMRGESVEVDPRWIDDVQRAYDAHDASADDIDDGQED